MISERRAAGLLSRTRYIATKASRNVAKIGDTFENALKTDVFILKTEIAGILSLPARIMLSGIKKSTRNDRGISYIVPYVSE